MNSFRFGGLRMECFDSAGLTSAESVDLLMACSIDPERGQAVISSVPASATVELSEIVYQDDYAVSEPPGQYRAGRKAVVEALSEHPDHALVGLDITSLMRGNLIEMVDEMFAHGVQTVRCFYAEPIRYEEDEETKFARKMSHLALPVRGFANPRLSDTRSNDLLIVGVGYDKRQLRVVLDTFRGERVFVYGLPALQPGMYQESVLRAEDDGATGFLRPDVSARRFAAAHDPYDFADQIVEITQQHEDVHGRDFNLLMCPLGPKPQALGCALFFKAVWDDRPGGIYLPEILSYSRTHAEGLSNIWQFDLPAEAWNAGWS